MACSDSSLPRTDQSDSEALKEPSTSENLTKTDKPPSRRRSDCFVLFFHDVNVTPNCIHQFKITEMNYVNHMILTQFLLWMTSLLILSQHLFKSVHPSPAHKHEDGHTTRQLHCQRWSGQCRAKCAPNTAWVCEHCAPMTDTHTADDAPYLVVNWIEVGNNKQVNEIH